MASGAGERGRRGEGEALASRSHCPEVAVPLRIAFRQYRLRTLLLAVSVACIAAAVWVTYEKRSRRYQGKWRVVECYQDGTPVDRDSWLFYFCEVSPDTISIYVHDGYRIPDPFDERYLFFAAEYEPKGDDLIMAGKTNLGTELAYPSRFSLRDTRLYVYMNDLPLVLERYPSAAEE